MSGAGRPCSYCFTAPKSTDKIPCKSQKMRTARNCIGDTQFQENRKKTNPSAAEIINGRVLPGDGSNLPTAKSDEDDDDWQQLTTTKGQETRNYHDNSSYNNNWVTGAREGERANAKQSGSCWIPFFFLFLSSFFVFFLPSTLLLSCQPPCNWRSKVAAKVYLEWSDCYIKYFWTINVNIFYVACAIIALR